MKKSLNERKKLYQQKIDTLKRKITTIEKQEKLRLGQLALEAGLDQFGEDQLKQLMVMLKENCTESS